MASTTASFLSATSSMSTTMSPLNSYGLLKRSSEKRNTGLWVRGGTSGVKKGTWTM